MDWKTPHAQWLAGRGACAEAVEWADRYSTLQAAYDACDRGDWMLWLWSRAVQAGSPDHKRLLKFAAGFLQVVSPVAKQPPLDDLVEKAGDCQCPSKDVSVQCMREAAKARDLAAFNAAAAAESLARAVDDPMRLPGVIRPGWAAQAATMLRSAFPDVPEVPF